jgi:hypothetical protein
MERPHPVAVDIETLQISVLEQELPTRSWPVFALDDRLLFVERTSNLPYSEDAVVEYSWHSGEWNQRRLAGVYLFAKRPSIGADEGFLLTNDALYLISRWGWYEIDVDDDCRVIPLTRNFVADEIQFWKYAASAHYGIVAWNDARHKGLSGTRRRAPDTELPPFPTFKQPIGQVYRLAAESQSER